MTRLRPPFVLTLAFFLLSESVRADAPPLTLAQALAAAETPKEDVYLTVAAEKVTLPPDAAPPQKGDPASQVAQSYGRILRGFGGVIAAAPPTMTILNTDPGTPNPYEGMPPGDALNLLLASLSDAQWKTLTGTTGLGPNDLQGDTQKALYEALFPAKSAKLYPRREVDSYGGEDESKLLTLTPEAIQAAHLRLGQRVTLGMPPEGDGQGTFNALGASPGGLVRYELYPGVDGSALHDTLYGVTVRAVVPNVSKPSDLDYDAKALRARVSLIGIKTVGDLVSRIGGIVKTELYADPRYEKRSVTWVGPPSARAADLLRALALCVAGAYRKVGPASVLTDDLMGEGTRQAILSRFVEASDLARHGAVADAGDKLVAVRGMDTLPPLDSALTLTDAQKAPQLASEYHLPGTRLYSEAPFAKLTPAQQAFARRFVETWNARLDGMTPQEASEEEKAKLRVTLAKPLSLGTAPTLLLQTPSVPGAILLDSYFNTVNLFAPSDALIAHHNNAVFQKRLATRPAAPAYVPPPSPALGPLLTRVPRRAVLARPRTAKEVGALVASMKTIGLNQLWLDVFSGGKSRLDGDPDILTEALARTKGTGIIVFAALDLLRWGIDAPEDVRDRTLLGETSAEADVYQDRYQAIKDQGKTPEEAKKLPLPTDLSVCPVAPAVQGPLLALIRRLAATEGVAGLALRDTQASGYDRPDLSQYGTIGSGHLGYAPVLRLAFLRRTHLDPVDLLEEHSNRAESAGADTSLPEFDDYHITVPATKDWGVFRAGADVDLLQRIWAAARPVPPRKPAIWVAQRRPSGRDDWFGLWDGEPKLLPEKSEALAYGGDQGSIAAFAHGQCRTNLYALPSDASASRDAMAYALQNLPPGWDGFVLDLSGGDGADPLAGLLPPVKKSGAMPEQRPGK